MTVRDRFRAVFNFEMDKVDRMPMVEWAAWWDVTIRRWEDEGFPKLDWEGSLSYFGLEPLVMLFSGPGGPGLPKPAYHGAGIIKDEEGYERILPYLYTDQAIENVRTGALALKERHERGEIIVRLWLDGFFWWPRGLLGIENHLYAFYDQPELIHRINRDLCEFNKKVADVALNILTPDMAGIAEDMSYNHGPMLSRELFDEFLAPYYKEVVPLIRAKGVPVLVDTDGLLHDMIPWLMGVGVEGVYPLERQSGVDVAWIRETYPKFLMLGGFDKIVMNKGEEAIRAEFERLLPVMKKGGFVPSVDHQTPPGVSFEDYKTYARLLAEYAKKACQK